MTADARHRFVGQRALLWAIRTYRRHLSGHGPLARVRCTFEGTESCSRYGERIVAHHASGVLDALRLIGRRVRRCREASLYRADGDAWTWGELYDRGRCDDELSAARELDATRALVHRSAALVAAHGRRDPHLARRHLAAAAALAPTTVPVIVRQASPERLIRLQLKRRLLLVLVAAALLGTLGGLLLGPLLGVVLGGSLGLIGSVGQLADGRRQRRRFADLAARGRFVVRGALASASECDMTSSCAIREIGPAIPLPRR